MDLELIVRAMWRKRGRLLLWTLAFAVLLPLGASVLFPPKYASSTVINVYPSADVDGSIIATYNLNPDRYVGTQVAVIAAREAAARVAKALHIDTLTVQKETTVLPVDKSDVITVTATSTNADEAAKIASTLANNYVNDVQAEASQKYADAIKSVDGQLSGLSTQIEQLNASIKATGGGSGDPGPLQSQLNNLVSQQITLTSSRQKYVVDSQTSIAQTRIVSTAAPSSVPTGLSKKTLAIYGAALGFGLGSILIALSTTPGRMLGDLESTDRIDGVEVIGVIELRRSSPIARRFFSQGVRARETRRLRIASELRTLINNNKGRMVVVPVGRRKRVQRATELLSSRLGEGRLSGTSQPQRAKVAKGASTEDEPLGLYWTDSLSSFLARMDPDHMHVVLAVDIEKVSHQELVDMLVTLNSYGTEVMGIVGVR